VIVDAYNNVWEAGGTSDYLTGVSHGVEAMIADMDAAGVEVAVGCSLGQMVDNSYLVGVCRAHPGRIFGFGGVNPRSPGAAEEVRSWAEVDEIRGLKLHPTMHGYHFADHGLLDPVFAACRDAGLVVLVNALDDPFCAPLAVEEISRGFPEVPVILAHMGSVWNVTEAILVAGRNDNLYLETSSAQLLDVKSAYEKLGPHKIVMGTDWPGSDFDLERLKIRKAVPDPNDRALVEGENMAALLGLVPERAAERTVTRGGGEAPSR
jgi:predicted TIM-barrel fold metal-dependent hydrolase